ncbi:DUF6438 domain-containing protein [Tenacibaculum tangerinum]|uniref:DUF6438 domain-containing protein n=1 Tax=Tenacibaculum tangerinum TaxID=3038772 RepID=A0ABY8L7H5_9FLAO|nr:DUF6438 domain-containing protein [Tenacibaculum tangerinum]WGH76592.1 DUF6438 domain-containing protein [Tenacibaculum tangerinum]
MKYLFYAFLALLSMCNTPKSSENESAEPPLKEITPEKVVMPATTENELIVVLKNTDNINEVKELIRNSGLTWNNTPYNTEATTIGIIKVPDGKRDFWKNKLQESNEFRFIEKNTEEKLTDLISEEKNNLLRITKTPCFGDCPVYTVAIDKEGNVVYNGIQYVLVQGAQEFKLSKEQLQELNDKLLKKEFSSFKKVYDNPEVLDLGSTYIVYDGKQVTVRLWKDIPKELIDIHEYVDGILYDKKFFE